MVGELLKRLRLEKGLTQKQCAAEIGINNSSLSSYETGRYEVPRDLLPRLEEYFGLNEGALTGEGARIEMIFYHKGSEIARYETNSLAEAKRKYATLGDVACRIIYGGIKLTYTQGDRLMGFGFADANPLPVIGRKKHARH